MYVLLNGTIAQHGYFKDIILGVTLRPGELTQMPKMTRGMPILYITVLDRPTPDQAVIAVGPRGAPEGKPS